MALVLLAVFSTLGVVFLSEADLNVRKGRNYRDGQSAQFAADSGLAFMNYALCGCAVPVGASGQSLLGAIANDLSSKLNGTANLQGEMVGYDGAAIAIPNVPAESGRTFSAQLYLMEDMLVQLRVFGRIGLLRRSIGVSYQLIPNQSGPGQDPTPPGGSTFFGYGIASRSKITITGNARIVGATSADEASVLSATYSDLEALRMTGNALIAGDVSLSNPEAYVTLTGNVSIGGASGSSDEIEEHIHIVDEDVEFPEVDSNVFVPYAVNIVDANTATNGNLTFNNIRILATTNPIFSGDINLNGVIYIEAPNAVRFTGNLTLKGVIVTEDAGEGVYEQNTVKFSGNTSVQGVEFLPDTPAFHDLRQMPGSFLLAPGFGVEFTGNFGTVSGTMAADSFRFTGNAGGVVKGMIINYSDSQFELAGNSCIIIDRSDDIQRSEGTDHEGTPAVSPGFVLPPTLIMVPSSYMEY